MTMVAAGITAHLSPWAWVPPLVVVCGLVYTGAFLVILKRMLERKL